MNIVNSPIQKTNLILNNVLYANEEMTTLHVVLNNAKGTLFKHVEVEITNECPMYIPLKDIADMPVGNGAKVRAIDIFNMFPTVFSQVTVKTLPYYITDKEGKRIQYPEGHPNENLDLITDRLSVLIVHGMSVNKTISKEVQKLEFVDTTDTLIEALKLQEYMENARTILSDINRD